MKRSQCLRAAGDAAWLRPGLPCSTFLHDIRECPLFDTQGYTWLERLRLLCVPQFGDAELLRWIFDLRLVPNSHPAVSAHVHYVVAICYTARSLCESLQIR